MNYRQSDQRGVIYPVPTTPNANATSFLTGTTGGNEGLWDIVRRLQSEGRTVLLTTHYMEEAEVLCDRVGIMDHGRILELGSPRDLIAGLEQPSHAEIEFLGEPPDPAPLSALLGRPVDVKPPCWVIALADPRHDLQQLLNGIERLDVPMRQLHVRRASLEDVFLQRTGRSLRD